MPAKSSFFHPGRVANEGQLASLHITRDHSMPVILSTEALQAAQQGYAEGVVTNTKFGSFPHSTLIGASWGSQVRASKVDTGSRGRNLKKRKAEAISTDSPVADVGSPVVKEAATANSGYIHVLPPTPENWTTSLPHRTQVVYTPDYSYILHRIRARPGSVLIEAGSGSGSFTHAAARAVYNGTRDNDSVLESSDLAYPNPDGRGKVFTFEFHEERYRKVHDEMLQHGLSRIVRATHRDVYREGFLLNEDEERPTSPKANAVFLDLPAPWEALKHLSRSPENSNLSALDPLMPVHICTFSPCIEQAQKTISAMRKQGWVDIEMVEMQHKRIEVRREFVGLKYEGMRSVSAVPATVDEAFIKLKQAEQRALEVLAGTAKPRAKETDGNKQQDAAKVLYNEGRIVHRSEPELKTHTSYLVFAILPRTWTEDDDLRAREKLGGSILEAPKAPKSQRQMKREARQRKKQAKDRNVNGPGPEPE